MAYTITIGSYTFPVTTVFTENVDNTWDEAGYLQTRTESILIRGIDKGTTASGTFGKLDDLRNVALSNQAQTVTIALDGVTKREFTPADAFDGPYIENYTEQDTPGGKANHTAFQFRVRVGIAGKQLFGEDVQTLDRVSERQYEAGQLVRVTFRVTVKAKTATKAEQIALQFKPTDIDPLDELRVKQLDQSTFTVTWVWDRPASDKIITTSESMSVEQGGKPLNSVTVTGGKPIIRKGQERPWRITITRTINFNAKTLAAARSLMRLEQRKLHYDKRDLDETKSDLFSDPLLVDTSKLNWSGTIIESYLFDKKPTRFPDHSKHQNPPPREDGPDDDTVIGNSYISLK